MSIAAGLMSLKSPKPVLHDRLCYSPPLALSSSPSLRFQPLFGQRACRISAFPRNLASPLGLGCGVHFFDRQLNSLNRSFVASAASHEEHNESEIEVEKENGEVDSEGVESKEPWKQTLASFRKEATKMLSVSEEAYKVNSVKAMDTLKETSEQLKYQAEKAKENLSEIASEFGEESKEYLSKVAENSNEDYKEIIEAIPSPDDFSDVSQTRDYHVGLAYGLVLSVGGFLSFMLTGSIPAVRFGIILGAALLFLTTSSIKSQNKGQPYALQLKGQAAISAIIFLREIRLLPQRTTLSSLFTAIASGLVLAFYVYKITVNRNKGKGSNPEHGTEN